MLMINNYCPSIRPKAETQNKEAFNKMETCINEIRHFLSENKLSDNADKTEIIFIGNKGNLA